MKTRKGVLTLGALLLMGPATLKADELQPEAPAVTAAARDAMRHEAAAQEYLARIDQYQAGDIPVTVVVQANLRWLQTSLIRGVPNAAVNYDNRARTIESMALQKAELGSGSRQDLAQAKEARLDVMLRRLLGHSTADK